MDASERRKHAASEASDWFSRMQAGEMDRAEREQFVEWLRESHLHVSEMLRVAQIHGSLRRFGRWSRISTGPKMDADNLMQFPPQSTGAAQIPEDRHPENHSRPSPTRKIPRGNRIVAFAATVLLVVGTSMLLPIIRGQVIETERGERREVVLADGSMLQVDPETRLRVQYAERVRRVFLERGRAVFRVAKNPNRPFLVRANDTTVRAVGTAFGVEQGALGVVVTVAEGKVSVSSPRLQPSVRPATDADGHQGSAAAISSLQRESRPDEIGKFSPATPNAGGGQSAAHSSPGTLSSGDDPRGTTPGLHTFANLNGQGGQGAEPGEIFLTANQQLMVQTTGSAEPVRAVDSARALAWADGRLIFQNDELSHAVAEFNRYNRVQLTVADPILAKKLVSGVFNAAEPEAFVAFVQSVASVVIVRDGDKTISIGSSRGL